MSCDDGSVRRQEWATGDEAVELARRGPEAFDAALELLGEPPLPEHPHLEVRERLAGLWSRIALDKPGAAPLELVFGPDVQADVAGFAEAWSKPAGDPAESLRDDLAKLLRSHVLVSSAWWGRRLTVCEPARPPWLRRTDWGNPGESRQPVFYRPFVE